MNEEFDPLDESAGAPEDASEVLERFSRRYRKVYAALHFSLVTAILVAGTVWLDNWVYALLIYIGVRLLLPKGMELFSFMGDYETDSMVVGVGEHVRTIHGNFTEHYGIFSVLRDLLIYGEVPSLPELERERLPFKAKYDPERPMTTCPFFIKNVTPNVLY